MEKVIKAETDLEKSLIMDEALITGLYWGKPRSGHPEGVVIDHVIEVLENVDKYSTAENRETLRLITIVHDSFKHKVNTSMARVGENHHAMIARRFAQKYIDDKDILDIIEMHDEAYNAWCKGDRDGKWDKAELRAKQLLRKLGDNIDLYLIFYQCDNETGDKEEENFKWFQKLVNEQTQDNTGSSS